MRYNNYRPFRIACPSLSVPPAKDPLNQTIWFKLETNGILITNGTYCLASMDTDVQLQYGGDLIAAVDWVPFSADTSQDLSCLWHVRPCAG